MPTYVYACKNCSHRFELWQEVGAQAPACPECGAQVKKVIQATRAIFKGPGFYVTDLRSEKTATTSKTDKAESSEAKTETKSEASESKPAESSAASTSSDTSSTASTSGEKK